MTWPTPLICLVTDRRRLQAAGRTWRDESLALLRFCQQAIDAGVTLIQLRERDVDGGPLSALTRDLVHAATGSPTRIVVNDRADVARAAGADGVHLRSASVPSARLRGWGGGRWVVGRSVHTAADAAAERTADYGIFGTVFATASKAGGPVAGIDGLRAAVRAATIGLVAIGGITADRVAAVAEAGAVGVAGIGLFLPPGRSPDALGPVQAVRAIRAAFDQAARVTYSTGSY